VRSAVASLLLVVGAACASLPSSSSVPTPLNGGLVVARAPKLQRAPYDQPYVLVRAGEMFANTTGVEDSLSDPAAQAFRDNLGVPFAAVGWYETARDRARFHVAILFAQRTVTETSTPHSPQSPNVRCPPQPQPFPPPKPGDSSKPPPPPPRRCDPSQPANRPLPTSTSSQVTRTIRGFAIRRVSDGAIFWRTYVRLDGAAAEQLLSEAILELVMGK
jgi:hypothetical protein